MEYNIKRKQMIKRRFEYINSEIDTDILIKDYIKSKYKYKKGSIYHKIITSIKLNTKYLPVPLLSFSNLL